jgi:two-component system cell cycle sensor histidine kinase/response regulator CckA
VVPEHFLIAALNAVPEPVFILDGAGRCVFANGAFQTLLGISGGTEVGGADFVAGLPGLGTTEAECTAEFRANSGETLVVKLEQTPLLPAGRIIRVVAHAPKDETLESFHAQRLETLGMLSGGVAHDFNNILAGILGHVSYLKMILPGAGPHVESLAAVEEGAKKASSITQQILNFSRLDPSERPTRLDLNSLVGRTVGLLRGAISPEYNLECAAASRPIGIVAVEGKMAQVIINLAINARDAIATNGKILVAVGECSDPGELAEAFGGSDLSARRYAVLSVTDNGSGMPPEVVGRIFEPYFSTKKGRGTGLGLSTVAAIVREFGGAIVVDSAVGRGTTFAVYFPLLEAEASGASADLDDAALPRGTERILIVDDEYPIRNVLSVSLQHLGYAVDTAASGSEALEKYIRPGDYDLVLLDMLMPVLSGEETFFKLRSVDSAARVLVISGYTSERSVRNILEHGGLDFLPKPFTIDDLSRKVRECIDDPERHA